MHAFFDNPTSTWTFVVADPDTKDAFVIDSVLEFDPASGRIGTKAARGLAAFVQEKGYTIIRIMDTHVHADHATGALALKQVRRRWDNDWICQAKCSAPAREPTYLYRPKGLSSAADIRSKVWLGTSGLRE